MKIKCIRGHKCVHPEGPRLESDQFYPSSGYLCRECHKKASRERYYNKSEARRTYDMARNRAQTLDIDFDFTYKEWKELYDACEGRCSVTKKRFSDSRYASRERRWFRPHVASPDRIDQSKGYVPGNVRFTTADFNIMRGTLSDDVLVGLAHGIMRSRGEWKALMTDLIEDGTISQKELLEFAGSIAE